ncbi:hypothetical protein ASG11_00195 [Sphingomonas sp. Leaf357]|uniref:DUF2141 domain-containing protein n=1 Tax=Sphingomonas sp. Leaf357 TaxID=1736350 RepID=UPI0006FEEF62|nr:DUF2141 domain-containing protein [Sphingomonas sp. Leaf357]KQS02888.1 hypothetical protein ASG11_00195 [Sphingomonas sp. Leaf357]
MKSVVVAAILAAGFPTIAWAQPRVLGGDAAACSTGGPAIRVNVVGLKDRTGDLKLELYPATEEDFLKDDHDLVRQGKVFHRVTADIPASGDIAMCIRVPRPGRYALLFTHNRDGRNKFNFWSDGAGFPSNQRLGRAKPKLAQAVIDVPAGTVTTTIRAQYLRGFGGFSPIKAD